MPQLGVKMKIAVDKHELDKLRSKLSDIILSLAAMKEKYSKERLLVYKLRYKLSTCKTLFQRIYPLIKNTDYLEEIDAILKDKELESLFDIKSNSSNISLDSLADYMDKRGNA
jgi:hypothetical protein